MACHSTCSPGRARPVTSPHLGAALAGLALLGAGCCPEPAASDGKSASTDGASTAGVRYSSLQRDVFDRRCVTDCHEAVNAGAGLTLGRDRSYGALVNQRSQEITTRFRVLPGDVAGSYLIKKVEGTVDYIGDRMPKGAPRLPQGEIDGIRVWIGRGAPND